MAVLTHFKRLTGVKLKASTLVETLTATVILLIVFSIAIAILLSVFQQTVHKNDTAVQNYIHQLSYQIEHHKLKVPYNENFYNWRILVKKDDTDEKYIHIIAVHKISKNRLEKRIFYVKN